MAGYPIEERPVWRHWVTPRRLAQAPIHRWFVFPHSFTGELVHALIDEWQLGAGDRILDPFVGAGTTVLAAREHGIPCAGYDLLPLAVLASRVKSASYDIARLEQAWQVLQNSLDPDRWNGAPCDAPELVKKALPGKLLNAFAAVAEGINALPFSATEQDFFHLALLATVPQYSLAVATGGWLKWVNRQADVATLPASLTTRIEDMLQDLRNTRLPGGSCWHANQADARQLPDPDEHYTAVITSPPYPNRHDYTRVFGVELMLGFLDWEGTRRLRYQSFHSHPEARPERREAPEYVPPPDLVAAVARLREMRADPRVPALLEGYFLDMYLCLSEMARVCRPGARLALVVGNAQYYGESVMVDELTAQVGEQVGLHCETLLVARYRGNSAQQMARYGRKPSRESVVILRKPNRLKGYPHASRMPPPSAPSIPATPDNR